MNQALLAQADSHSPIPGLPFQPPLFFANGLKMCLPVTFPSPPLLEGSRVSSNVKGEGGHRIGAGRGADRGLLETGMQASVCPGHLPSVVTLSQASSVTELCGVTLLQGPSCTVTWFTSCPFLRPISTHCTARSMPGQTVEVPEVG